MRRQHSAVSYRLPAGARRLLRGVRIGLGAAQTLSIAQMITAAAGAYGVDPSLALAVAQRESGLNPNLVNPASGASGVMQLMPATAAALGVTNIMDPQQNINAGVKYLSQLLAMYGGDVAKTVAAYDWGPGNLNADLSANGENWLAFAPAETQAYVQALTGQTPGAAPASPSSPPLTIDASTGEVVPSSVDVSTLPVVNADGTISPPAAFSVDLTDPTTLAAIGLAGFGLWYAFSNL